MAATPSIHAPTTCKAAGRNRVGGDKASIIEGLDEPSSCALSSRNRSSRWIRFNFCIDIELFSSAGITIVR
jgi:hypothetical protein